MIAYLISGNIFAEKKLEPNCCFSYQRRRRHRRRRRCRRRQRRLISSTSWRITSVRLAPRLWREKLFMQWHLNTILLIFEISLKKVK